jgi:hypothetical protein
MFRCRWLFLVSTVWLIAGLSRAQAPTSGGGQSSDSKAPATANGTPQSGASLENPEPGVLVVKGPQLPPARPQIKPELRAVDLENRQKLTETTKRELIHVMDAEFAHVRKYFPLGDKSLVINPQGQVSPGDAAIFQQIQLHGAAAKVGDRVQITNLVFHDKSISFQINGGAKKKSKWYQHISIGMGPVTPVDGVDSQPTGAEFSLQFAKHIPEMNAEELRKLLSPVLDFAVKSSGEAYAETLPPKIREAIKNHEVLVGMNHDMVVLAKERPPQKVRDKDERGKEYEEWIYGAPPQDVMFVRFMGDEVTQVKIAKIGAPVVVKTQKEVDVKDGVVTLASLQSSDAPEDAKPQNQTEDQQPQKRPTLRRPGEEPAEEKRVPNGPVASHPGEPEWGTDGKQQPPANQAPSADQQKQPSDQPPAQEQQKPPQ